MLEAITFHTRLLPEDKRIPAIVEEAKRKWGPIAERLEAAVDGPRFVLGRDFSAADTLVGSTCGWLGLLGMIEEHPKLTAYLDMVSKRPAYKRAYAD